jgi:hypothetical protein
VVLEKEERPGMNKLLIRIAIALVLFSISLSAFADSSALILSGVPGDSDHAEKFNKWSDTTRKLLVDKFGFTADRVIVLADKNTAKTEIQKAFDQLKTQLKPADTFFLFMIGHGSYDTDYKFNIFGPDFTGMEYSQLLNTLKVARIVIINGTSASGGALETMAGKNRVIVTATKSGHEGNEPLFYEYFLQALQNSAADEDKDGKVSIWEAFKFATDSVDRFYKEEGRLATEHPQLSDSGAPMIDTKVKEPPALARITTFQVDRPVTVSDPKLQALLNDKHDIEQKIEALKIDKAITPQDVYDKQMEELLIQLATKSQEIKAQENKKP